ncbi:transposase [Nitrosomonas sp. Nm33]|uniref:transposase n=1 Tax=Nitrosomonas sp. Nm33 TaxID=133724 RepID=UPI00089D7AF8|nr:transposase [Nitrosomonas sp. Nm33]SDZ12002.1 Transposase [Nitrosomonas sp. Nm33]
MIECRIIDLAHNQERLLDNALWLGCSDRSGYSHMDLAYIGAVQTHFSKVMLVFDHCHIIKLFNEKLTKLRRNLQRETKDGLSKFVLG